MLNRTRLRPIERHDVGALLAIIRDENAPADFSYDTYQSRRTIYFVALVDDEVVGGAGIAPRPGDDPLTCELQRMVLKPAARGEGVGKLLLDACLESARRFWYVRCQAETMRELKAPQEVL